MGKGWGVRLPTTHLGDALKHFLNLGKSPSHLFHMDQSLFQVKHQIVKLVVYLLLREAVNNLGYLVFTSCDGGRQACPPLAHPKDGKDEAW